MKKVAILHYAYPPNIGGVERLIKEQAMILADLDYEITVLTGSGEENDSRVKIVTADVLQSVLNFNPNLYKKIVEEGIIDTDFYDLSSKIETVLEMNLEDKQTVIIHNMLTLVHNLPFIYAFKKYAKNHPEKNIIVWAHDQTYIHEEKVLDDKPGVNLSPEGRMILIEPLEKAKYVVISNQFKQLFCQAINIDKEKVIVIPDGINIKNFLEIDPIVWEVVNKEKLLDCFPVVLSPVNILPRKNIEFNIEVVHYLKKNYPDIKLIITGKISAHRKIGNYPEEIDRIVKKLSLEKNVIYMSRYLDRALYASELHDLYALADAVFYFSKSENFGLPIIESALVKTPVFTSKLKVFREIAENKLIEIDLAKNSAEQTARIIADHMENDNLIKINRLVRQRYNQEEIIKRQLVPLL